MNKLAEKPLKTPLLAEKGTRARTLRDVVAYAEGVSGVSLTQILRDNPPDVRECPRVATAAPAETAPPDRTTPPPRPRTTRRRRPRESAADRRERISREHVERFRRENRAKLAAVPEDVPTHRRETFRRCQAYLADASGRSVRWWYDNCPHKPFVQRILEGALVPRADGSTRYRLDGNSLGARRARSIAVLGILIYENTRKTRNGRVCRGLSEEYQAAMLADPFTGARPHRNTINGRHRRDGSVYNGQVGYLRALVETGALKRKQYKDQEVIRKVCQPWELSAPIRLKSGAIVCYPINWYTLPDDPRDVIGKKRGAELAAWLDEFEASCQWDPWAPNPAPLEGAQPERAHAPP